MKQLIVASLFYGLTAWSIQSNLLDKAPNTEGPWVVCAYYSNKQQVQKASEITSLWQMNTDQHYVSLIIDNSEMFNKLMALNLKIRVDAPMHSRYVTAKI